MEKESEAKGEAGVAKRPRSRKGKGGPENAMCTYRGVRQRTWGKWVAEIREPKRGARLWLGIFNTSLQVAIACDDAARRLYGASAKLNLPAPPSPPTAPINNDASHDHNLIIPTTQPAAPSLDSKTDETPSDLNLTLLDDMSNEGLFWETSLDLDAWTTSNFMRGDFLELNTNRFNPFQLMSNQRLIKVAPSSLPLLYIFDKYDLSLAISSLVPIYLCNFLP
ncbi:Dehydration-responsive element-binding protein 2G [Spatholobus suberectus]|nr:Dehydration-responsive element-binding protein 2G [Spatholobus suberectus]